MTRHVVIGTAGHVDHGKTALVKALTGVDTDRWEEEKRRGITIDLGFAPLALPGGLAASVVDVPGHEDFIRNMVAGAAGVDAALLVVAADEGVMPQTVEHLAILEFLGVRAGAVALSKADLVEPDWLELVAADVATTLAASGVAWEAPVVTSAVTGVGLDALRGALTAAARRAAGRRDDDLFRLPVDRAFSVAGAGTVVTGTTWSGSVAVGDEVRVLPEDLRGRVRGVQVHGEGRDHAAAGRRTALALAGVDRARVGRGSVVVADPSWRSVHVVDVLITLLPEARPLTQRSRVRLHLGTAEVMARVTPEQGGIAPGQTAGARLRLEQPVVARWGDRGVLRSYSPVTTIGGCVVVDPWPDPKPRRPRGLAVRGTPDPTARLHAFVAGSGTRGLPVSDLAVRVGVPTAAARAPLEEMDRVGHQLVASDLIGGVAEEILGQIRGYHESHPLEPGVPVERLRTHPGGPALVDHVLDRLRERGAVRIESGVARSPDHRPALTGGQVAWGETLRGALAAAGAEGRSEAELGEAVPPDLVRDLAEYYVRHGTAIRLGRDRYYDRFALERLRDELLGEVRRLGRASPSQLRDKSGLSRKYLIPVLEWLDACGVTVREGDVRRVGPRAEADHPSA